MKTKYSSTPSNVSVYKIGALLIAIGFAVSLVLSLKASFTTAENLICIDTVILLLDYAVPVIGAAMLMKNDKYGFKFPILLILLGSFTCGLNAAAILCIILVLISLFAFRLNVKYKYWRWTKTPWLNLIASIIAVILVLAELGKLPKCHGAISFITSIAAIMISVGIFIVSFFTESKEDVNLKNIEIGKMNFANQNVGHIIGVVMIAIDFIFVLVSNLEAVSASLSISSVSGLLHMINVMLPLIAYFAAVYMMAYKPHCRKGWAVAILLMAVYQYSASLENVYPVMPTAVFFFMFALTCGFEGNTAAAKDKKIEFTVFKIVAMTTLLLCAVVQIKEMVDYASECMAYNAPLAALKEKAGFPFDESYKEWISECQKTFMLYIPGLFRIIGLMLVVTFSKTVQEEAAAIKMLAKWFKKAEDSIRNFFDNVGSKIRSLAKIIAKIALVIALICLTVTGIGVVLFILFKLTGNSITAMIPMSAVLIFVLIGIACAIGWLIFALPFWFVYAFGQITSDVTEINEDVGSMSNQDLSIGEGDENLPEL